MMAFFFTNLGFDGLMEGQMKFNDLVSIVGKLGKRIPAYSDMVYIRYDCGQVSFIEIAKKNETGQLEIFDIDAIVGKLWTVNILKELDKDNSLRRSLLVSNKRGNSRAVINLIDGEVLPSILEGDKYTFQVGALPDEIHYFADEDEYNHYVEIQNVEILKNLRTGEIFPLESYVKHNELDLSDLEKREMCKYVLVKGIVKEVNEEHITIGFKPVGEYFCCTIDTEFGELKIYHTYSHVKMRDWPHMNSGSIVYASCLLSACSAEKEYRYGIIENEENHLKMLKHVLVKGEAERLRSIIDEGCLFEVDNENIIGGKNNIINRINEIQALMANKYSVQIGTIEKVLEDDKFHLHKAGDRCVAYTVDGSDKTELIVFMDIFEEYIGKGTVTNIHVTKDPCYLFCADKKCAQQEVDKKEEEKNSTEEAYRRAVLNRAKVNEFIDNNENVEKFFEEDGIDCIFRRKVKELIEAWPDNIPKWEDTCMRQFCGYMFAKGVEGAYIEVAREKVREGMYPLLNYKWEDIWNDTYNSVMDSKSLEGFNMARKLGKYFLDDILLHYKIDEDFEKNFIECVVFLQKIGRKCGIRYMEKLNTWEKYYD